MASMPTGASTSQLSDFAALCGARTGRELADPHRLDDFSISDPDRFWALFLEWADPLREGDEVPVRTDARCEHASFFPGLRLNYAENLLRSRTPADDERVAVVAVHAGRPTERITRAELRERVRALAAHLRGLGVAAGDRVVAIADSNAEAIVGGLAAATIGAALSTAAPQMGVAAIRARFEQLEPKVLLANLGDGPGDTGPGRAGRIAEVAAALPALKAIVALDEGPPPRTGVPVLPLARLLREPSAALGPGWERFEFDHPLFVPFTSGTTGPPKGLVHGAGGTLIEHLKEHRLHLDLGPRDTLFFHTTTAWMMWNWQLSALAAGTAIVTYDGPLQGPGTLWEVVAEVGATVFGTSPPYLQLCQDSGYSPGREAPAPGLRSVLSTGSVLRDWQFDWVEEELGGVRPQSISGGTDIIGCFVLGHPDLPVRRGMIQARSLGLDVAALATETTPTDSAVGELVCRNPFPSRPVGLLGDDDGSVFHAAYFAANPGVWTHGDLIEFDSDGQARIHGRSDGVLNVQGVRIGPAEIYQALHRVPEVVEAMAVEQPHRRDSRLVLLAVLRDGAVLDRELTRKIRRAIAAETTQLHVPELVVAVGELPVTHSGKRSERAARDAVAGREVANLRALANPGSVEGVAAAVGEAGATPAAAPGGGTLGELIAIWEAVLGIGLIEPDEDFFELGGTSLSAARVFVAIEERMTGLALPISTMLEAPTPAALAQLLDSPEREIGPIVPMREGATADRRSTCCTRSRGT